MCRCGSYSMQLYRILNFLLNHTSNKQHRMASDEKCENKDIDDPYTFDIKLTKQIIVNTKPITRLPTDLISISKPLLVFAESFAAVSNVTSNLNNPDNQDVKYDYCVIVLDHDDIPSVVWNLVSDIFKNVDVDATHEIESNTIDDLLYILHKYDIQLNTSMKNILNIFIKKAINKHISVFKRMTCLESNPVYYKQIIQQIHETCDNYGADIKKKTSIVGNLSHQMAKDILVMIYSARYANRY